MKYITRTVFRNGGEGTLTHNIYKEEKNLKKNNRGFTLAELLIVVAIIAVLVAIAIPVFTTQLEKSREAVDLSNVRAAYAEVMSAALTNDTSPEDTTIIYTAGTKTWSKELTPLKQAKDDWQTDVSTIEIGGIASTAWNGTPKAGGKCTISYNLDTGAAFKWE